MPKDGGEETQVLESVDGRAFAVVREGIYLFLGRILPAVTPSNSSTSPPSGFDPCHDREAG